MNEQVPPLVVKVHVDDPATKATGVSVKVRTLPLHAVVDPTHAVPFHTISKV
jgi:hypothetical protein